MPFMLSLFFHAVASHRIFSKGSHNGPLPGEVSVAEDRLRLQKCFWLTLSSSLGGIVDQISSFFPALKRAQRRCLSFTLCQFKAETQEIERLQFTGQSCGPPDLAGILDQDLLPRS